MIEWIKSSYSAGNGACVERGYQESDGALIRDSKDPDGPVLVFTEEAWHDFLADVKQGQFDL